MGYSPPSYLDTDVLRATHTIKSYAVPLAANVSTAEWIDFRAFATMEITRKSGSGATFKVYVSDSEDGPFLGPKQYVDQYGDSVDLKLKINSDNQPTEWHPSIYSSAYVKIVADAAAVVDVTIKT